LVLRNIKLNIQSFIEKFILRDIVAIILPGGILLFSFLFIISATVGNTWKNIFGSIFLTFNWIPIVFLIFIAYVLGHIIDFIYRHALQKREEYRRDKTIEKELSDIRVKKAVNELFGIEQPDENIDDNIESLPAKNSLLLRYWIEQKNPQIYNSQIERPSIQAHFLSASGISFIMFGICVLISIFFLPKQSFSEIILYIMIATASWLTGAASISQGLHKRKILVENTYRVFYILWKTDKEKQKAGNPTA